MIFSQFRDTLPFDNKKELLYRGRRYAVHNNYILFSGGYNYSSLHRSPELQATYGMQLIFHIRRQHFNLGVLVSGRNFRSSRHVAMTCGYTLRRENELRNLAFSAGPAYNYGIIPPVISATDTIFPRLYQRWGGFISAHYIKKISYDIGVGLECFFHYDPLNFMAGLRLTIYFSGAYRGKENRVNRYVKYRIAG